MNAFERLGIDGRPVSGHAFLVQRARGPQWYVKFRLPDGRQVQRRLGPAWTGRGRPATGYLTRRSAQAVLDELLAQARAGTLPGMVRTGATFAQASAEWLRWQEQDRQRKRSTLDDYRSAVRVHLDPAFGDLQLEEITPRRADDWRRSLLDAGRLSNRSINKLLVLLHGILERGRKVWGLRENPLRDVERQPLVRRAHIDVYSTKEIRALMRSAASQQDRAIFQTAAFTGLRMGELIALRWRDVDLELRTIRVSASYSHRQLTTPKSGKGRAVPIIAPVARTLNRLRRRRHMTGPDDLVFPGPLGGYLDDSALRRRYKTARDNAGLRPMRFHDLRHTFGTHAIRTADPRELQEWMGHTDFSTTEIYLSYKPRADAARRLGDAFAQGRAPASGRARTRKKSSESRRGRAARRPRGAPSSLRRRQARRRAGAQRPRDTG
jgi:integrase